MAESVGYRVFRWLARFLAGLFDLRVEVAGLERVPLSGALVVAANHHQGSMAEFREILRLVPEPVPKEPAR